MAYISNADNYLATPTHDTSGQATHPSVIDFKTEYNLLSWGGYRYYMAMTPYPYGNDEHEDPNLLASIDGITWLVPNGLTNPLNDLGGTSYNADTDMVYDAIDNCLRVYFRSYIDNGDGTSRLELKFIKVYEDMTISSPIICTPVQNPYITTSDKNRSQSIWRESANKWHLWGNKRETDGTHTLWYSFSVDGVDWGTPIQCLDKTGQDPLKAKGYDNWHLSCKPNYKEGRVEFLVCDYSNTYLIYAECNFTTPTLIELPLDDVVMTVGSGWDNDRLYRSAFTLNDNSYGYYYNVWYSGVDVNNVWHIGYSAGVLPTINTNKKGAKTYLNEQGNIIEIESYEKRILY